MNKIIAIILSGLMVMSVAVSIPTVTFAESKETIFYGDVNGDGEITSADALEALQHSVQKITLGEWQEFVADVTSPVHVDAADALAILQYAVKKITVFNPPEREIPTASGVESSVAESSDDTSSEETSSEDTSFDLIDTVVDNGAYTKDPTADTNFVINGQGLAKKTFYYISFLDSLSYSEYAMLYAFQGIINRDFGMEGNHTAFIYFQKDASDSAWYNYMTDQYNNFEGYEKVVIRRKTEFFDVFKNQLQQCGYILWDPKVPATSNVALTICGVDGYLPVLAGSPAEELAKSWGMTQKMSLVDKFKDGAETLPGSTTPSSKSAKNDAYRWALENYFSRCSADYLAYTLDGSPYVPDNIFSKLGESHSNCIQNHDYIVARRAFVFDLYPLNDVPACDDPDQIKGTDNQTFKMIFEARYNRANGKFGQLLGFPPWWIKYSSDIKFPGTSEPVGSNPATFVEWYFSELITCYNLAKEADAAQPSQMSNGSVYYKYRISTGVEMVNNAEYTDVYYKSDVRYFTLYLGDYDSSAWMKHFVSSYWMYDNSRGDIPLMWAFNPNLSNRIPMAFEYIHQYKTDNDFFVAGDSGAGYIIPSALSTNTLLAYTNEYRPSKFGSGFDQWETYCKKFYDTFDLSVTGFIINGENPMTAEIADCYNKFSPNGSFHNDSSKPAFLRNGVPYVYMHNGVDQNTDYGVMWMHSKGFMSGYNFSAFRTVCVSPDNIKKIVEGYIDYNAAKDRKMQYVDPFAFFRMVRESNLAQEI